VIAMTAGLVIPSFHCVPFAAFVPDNIIFRIENNFTLTPWKDNENITLFCFAVERFIRCVRLHSTASRLRTSRRPGTAGR